MKHILYISLLLVTISGFAQRNKHEKIKAYKIAHITEALDLTEEEAAVFWPIYNASEEKMSAVRKSERKEIMAQVCDDMATLSDDEANALINKSIALKQRELEIHKSLIAALRGKIPPKKILLLKKAEDDFKRKLLEHFRNKRGEKR